MFGYVGQLEEATVAFLARHGRNHHLLPTELPFRANIHAMKQLGVEYIISASAVGSLQEAAKPLDMVIPDQFIDRTKIAYLLFLARELSLTLLSATPYVPI